MYVDLYFLHTNILQCGIKSLRNFGEYHFHTLLCHEDIIFPFPYNGKFSWEYRENEKYILDQKVNFLDKEIWHRSQKSIGKAIKIGKSWWTVSRFPDKNAKKEPAGESALFGDNSSPYKLFVSWSLVCLKVFTSLADHLLPVFLAGLKDQSHETTNQRLETKLYLVSAGREKEHWLL